MTGFEMIAMLATVAGGAMSAAGTIAAGKAQAAQAEAAAQQQEWQIAQNETRRKLEQGQQRIKADLAKRQKEQALGSFQAKQAGSGFLPGDHSSTAMAMNIEKYGTFDELMHLAGGQMARFEGQNISAGHQMNADLLRMQAADKSYMAGAAGTLIGSIGKGFGGLSGGGFLKTASGGGGNSSAARAAGTADFHPYQVG